MSFDAHVSARLERGAVEFADQSFKRPLAELLVEVQEEAADIGAWGRIAAAVLDRRADLEGAERDAIGHALRAAGTLAAAAWRQLETARWIVAQADSDGGVA